MTLKQRINELIKQHGSLRAAAHAVSVDATYLLRLSTGDKLNPSVTTLNRLGLRRIVSYERLAIPVPRFLRKNDD